MASFGPSTTSTLGSLEECTAYKTFNKIDWGTLDEVDVYTPNGDSCKFRSLYRPLPHVNTGPVVIHFLSNFACYAMVGRLSQWAHALNALDECHARLVFLATGTPQQCRMFLDKYEDVAPFPGDLYCDPNLDIYNAFNLKRGILRTIVPPLTAGFSKFGHENVCTGIKRRITDRHLIGDLWQMGGVFAMEGKHDDVHFRPNLLFAHVDNNTVHTASVDEVLEAIGYSGKKLDIDPAKSLAEFNQKRRLIRGCSRLSRRSSRSSKQMSVGLSRLAGELAGESKVW